MALIRYKTYNSTTRYKLRSPFFNGKGSFVLGVALTVIEDTSTHQDVTCFDGGDGSITVQASGGVSPYLYSIDGVNWQNSPTLLNLSITGPVTEGTDQYGGILICTKTIYVKDANSHVASIDVQLKSPVELEWLNVPSDMYVFCDPGQNYATVIFNMPTLSTIANIPNIQDYTNISGISSDNKYSPGANSILFTVGNDCYEFDEQQFTITVLPLYFPNAIQDYDGNWYDAVVIGNQVWLAQNLRTTHYADGTPIPAGGSTTSDTDPYYYDYSSSGIPLKDRGYLYNWPAVMKGVASSDLNPSGVQGIAPTGWHVPSDAEWTQLTNYAGGVPEYILNNNSTYIAKALASQSYWNASTADYVPGNDLTANNKTMFGAVPAGHCYGSSFSHACDYANFWSSTQYNNNIAYYRALYYHLASLYRSYFNKNNGYSVRCVCDLSPLDFAAWYYNQYGSYNHQIS